MKLISFQLAMVTALAAGTMLTGCGSAGDSTESQADELSGPTKEIPKHPTVSSAGGGNNGGPTTSSAKCGAGEKICQVANDKNICHDECVPDYVLCAEPVCVVCDPSGPAPEPGCKWDSNACEWLCI